MGCFKRTNISRPDRFLEKFSRFLKDRETLKEVSRLQRYATKSTLDELFIKERLEKKRLKDEIIYRAYIYYGYILKEIVEYLDKTN